MRISIIIPVHNNSHTLKRCVESYVNQKGTSLEIILVDDGSVDNSPEMCQMFENYYENITYIRQDNKGVSSARNRGLSIATGEIIGFGDADDFVEKDSLKHVEDLFISQNVDIVVGGFNCINESINVKRSIKKEKKIDSSNMIEHVLIDDNIMGAVWNKFISRDLLDNIYFDKELSYCEDSFFLIDLLSKHRFCNIVITPKILYNYVNESNSATNSFRKFFDGDGRLKYVVSFEKMLDTLELRKREQKLVKYKMYQLCLDMIINYDIAEEQYFYLKNNLKKYRVCWICNFHRNLLSNMKRIVKYFLVQINYQKRKGVDKLK